MQRSGVSRLARHWISVVDSSQGCKCTLLQRHLDYDSFLAGIGVRLGLSYEKSLWGQGTRDCCGGEGGGPRSYEGNLDEMKCRELNLPSFRWHSGSWLDA